MRRAPDRAEVLKSDREPSPLIHGRKGQALCHMDGIDSIFTRDEAREVAKAASQAGAKECYCLAWEFEMELTQRRRFPFHSCALPKGRFHAMNSNEFVK